MNLLAGVRGPAPRDRLQAMVQGLFARQGASANMTVAGNGIAMGGNLTAHDPQSGLLLVADARLDERSDLAASLGCDAHATDADLLLAAWLRWGEGAPSHLYGDYAFAIWDGAARRLTLARDALGQKPLFFLADGSAFASRANAFAALDARHGLPDAGGLAAHLAFVADRPGTCYRGVERVLPGEMVRISDAGIVRTRWWHPSTLPLSRRPADLLAEYRALLEQAVADRIADAGPVLATHLSAGLDSSIATALAARLRGGGVDAFTGVPASAPRGLEARFTDEGDLAARAAASLPNTVHHRVAAAADPLLYLDAAASIYQQPLPNPHNHGWVAAINERARAAGADVLLIGQTGNYSFSMAAHRFARLRSAAKALLGRAGPPRPPFLLGRAPLDLFGADPAPQRGADRRRHFLSRLDPGAFIKGTQARWGLEPRDPFAARRLVEYSLTISESTLARLGDRGLGRPVAATLLPAAFVAHRARGYQAADWTARLAAHRAAVIRFVDRARDHDLLGDLLDLPALRDAADRLPDASPDARLFRFDLPRALAVIAFVLSLETPTEGLMESPLDLQ